MGEGIIIGTVLVLSGLVLAIIKKSQGSSLPSEVDKKAYQTKLEDKLLHHYAANEAHWISKNLSDFIFDFGLDLQHDALVARYQDHAHLEQDRLHTQRIISPNQLCEQLVGRAIDLKINPARFERHMRALWVLLLVPIGKFAPRTLGQRGGAGVFYGTLTAMTFLGIEQERFLNSLG